MSDYIRLTRKCSIDSMNPMLSAAIRAHIEQHELEVDIASALTCCETISTKKKKGLFDGKPEVILTGVILTAHWLVWAAGREDEAPGVLAARLCDIQVQDHESSSMAKLIPDAGIHVSGVRKVTGELSSVFIGLGPEPAAQEFRVLLKEAKAKATS